MIDVSIIIVSYNSLDEILTNIESIRKYITSLSYEILVVNNYAADCRISDSLSNYDDIDLIEANSNLGFGKANNLGLEKAKGNHILFVNPDVIFLSDINQLTDMLESDTEIGLIGPAIFDGLGKILPSCGEYPNIKNFISDNLFLNHLFPKIKRWGNFSMKYFDFKGTAEVDWVSGAFMLGRKSTFKQIGGFDKDFFMYCEDVDICWRLKKAGYKIVFCDKASVIHNEGHAVQNKSVVKASMIVESSAILWNKYYSPGTVKKLFAILCLGSNIRKVLWKVKSLANDNKMNSTVAYYDAIVSESNNYLRRGKAIGHH